MLSMPSSRGVGGRSSPRAANRAAVHARAHTRAKRQLTLKNLHSSAVGFADDLVQSISTPAHEVSVGIASCTPAPLCDSGSITFSSCKLVESCERHLGCLRQTTNATATLRTVK